jgi:hypothetical protein
MQFYRERFPRLNESTGRTDMFPSQVIESYWCGNGGDGTNAWGHRGPDGRMPGPDPAQSGGRPCHLRLMMIAMIRNLGLLRFTYVFEIPVPIIRTNMKRSRYSRSECPTDGTPDVAGLQAVLSKLVALPASALPPSYHAADSLPAWKQSLARLPPLPLETCHYGGGNGDGCRTCAPNPHFNSSSCWCNGHWPCTPPNATERVVVRSSFRAGCNLPMQRQLFSHR